MGFSQNNSKKAHFLGICEGNMTQQVIEQTYGRFISKTTSSILTNPLVQLLYYLTIFSIPYYRWRTLTVQYPFLKIDWILVFFLVLIVIPYFLLQKRFPETLKSNLWPWLLLFFVVNLISSCLSRYPAAAFDGIRILILSYMFIALNLTFITAEGFRRIMPVVLGWSVAIGAFLSIIGYFFHITIFSVSLGLGFLGSRGYGPTIGANNMALMCIFTLPLLVHWAFYGRTPLSKLIAFVLIIVNVLGVVSTASRGGFLSLIIMSIFIFIEQSRRFNPRYLGIIIASFGFAFLIGLVILPEAYFERQQTITKGIKADVSFSRRAGYLKVGLDSFKKNPVLGTGTLTFKKGWAKSIMSRRFKMEERPPHNTYMDILVGTGILGLIIFFLVLWRAFTNFSQGRKIFWDLGNIEMASLVAAYRLSFMSVLLYFFVKSGIEHKFFLLALPLSEVALRLARGEQKGIDSEVPASH